MDRKSSKQEVYKLINQSIPELHKKLCEQLGEDNPFAKFNFGSGYYSWSDNRLGWKQMIEASTLEQSLIQNSLVDLKQRISQRIGEKATNLLFTYPDDSYIYYNDDEGVMKILITGWGFKKPDRIAGKAEIINIDKPNPVSLSFIYDGVIQSDFEFAIKGSRQLKHLKTDPKGFFSLNNLKVGEHYVLVDLQSGNEFDWDIIEGKSNYEFDITRYADCHLCALLDGKPLSFERASITYNNQTSDLTTDESGCAALSIPYHEGIKISAKMRGEEKLQQISSNEIHFDFLFETEKKPVSTEVKISVLRNSQPVPFAPITIQYKEEKYEEKTDSTGFYVRSLDVFENEYCYVNVDGYDVQSKILEPIPVNEFLFTKEVEPEPVHEEMKSPRIRVVYPSGEIAQGYPIFVEVAGNVSEYITDQNGAVKCPEFIIGTQFQVRDGMNNDNVKNYILEPETDDYIFTLPEIPTSDKKNLTIMFRDKNNRPIVCDNVVFRQEKSDEIVSTLDSEGNIVFKDGTFKLNVPIEVGINGWKNNQYHNIEFVVEPDEYEYLLQEKKTKSTWWKILVEGLLILVAAYLFLILWPIFESICSSMFFGLYN